MFTFDIRNPDVAVLTLQCFDEDIASSEFIGFSSLPVSCIRPGIRSVGLSDLNGQREREYAFATLCVRITLDAITEVQVQQPTAAPAFVRPSLMGAASIFNFKA